MMLDNATYNKIKLIYKFSDLLWFIEKHALIDAEKAGDAELLVVLKEIQKDLSKHLGKLHKGVCVVSQ